MEDQQTETTETYLEMLSLEDMAELVVAMEEQKAAIQAEIDEVQASMLERIPRETPFEYRVPDPAGGELGYTVTFSQRRREKLQYGNTAIVKALEEHGAKERFVYEQLDGKQFNAWFKGETDPELRDAMRPHIRASHKSYLHRDRLKELLKARGLEK